MEDDTYMTELELWVKNNYPTIYAEWMQSDEDIDFWLEDSHLDVLDEYDDWLEDDWLEEEENGYDDE